MQTQNVKIYPMLKHIFSQDVKISLQKNNLLLAKVIDCYIPQMEQKPDKKIIKETKKIVNLIKPHWNHSRENQRIVFDLFFKKFFQILQKKRNITVLYMLNKFLEYFSKDLFNMDNNISKDIQDNCNCLIEWFIDLFGEFQSSKQIFRRQSIEFFQQQFLIQQNMSEHTKLDSKGSLLVKNNYIPKLDLGLANQAYNNQHLLSRSTRRANQVSLSQRKSQNQYNNLMHIGQSLGQCFVSGDIVWFLKSQRTKMTQNNPELFKKNPKNDLTTLVPLPSRTVQNEKFDQIKSSKSSVYSQDNITAQSLNQFSRTLQAQRTQQQMDTYRSNYMQVENSHNNFQSIKAISQKRNFLITNPGEILIECIFYLRDFLKSEQNILRQILFRNLTMDKKIQNSQMILNFLFYDKTFLVKLKRQIFFNLCSNKMTTIFFKVVKTLIQNRREILVVLSENFIIQINIIFQLSQKKYANLQKQLLQILKSLVQNYPQHSLYISEVLLRNENIKKYLQQFFSTIDLNNLEENEIFQIVIKFFNQILRYKEKYKNLIIFYSSLIQIQRKEQRETKEKVFGEMLRFMVRGTKNGQYSQQFFWFLRILKNFLRIIDNGQIKSYFLRICYILFIKIYSNLSNNTTVNENIILGKLLSIIQTIIMDKNNEEVTSMIRQFKIIQFFGKEIDLEFESSLVKTNDCDQTLSFIFEDNQGTLNQDNGKFEIPKLNFDQIQQEKPKFKLDLGGQINNLQKQDSFDIQDVDSYFQQKKLRKIYRDFDIYKKMMTILSTLLLNKSCCSLEEEFTGIYPVQSGKLNYLYLLQKHLIFQYNQDYVQQLIVSLQLKISKLTQEVNFQNQQMPYERKFQQVLDNQNQMNNMAHKRSNSKSENRTQNSFTIQEYNEEESELNIESVQVYRGVLRLIKLLGMQSKKNYKIGKLLGNGAYSTVYNCQLQNFNQNFAIKVIEADKNIFERNAAYYLFNEISILESFQTNQKKDNQDLLRMYDFGLTDNFDYFVLFPKLKKCLKTKGQFSQTLILFYKICISLQKVHKLGITHYDLKADNIMLSEDGPVIVDYGEGLQNEQNFRLRGTEYIKSPEMLLSGFEKYEFDQIQGSNKYKEMTKLYNRQSKYNVGQSSDIWSLGCLLYELYTGEFLFYEKDWSVFYKKITSEDFQIFDKEFSNKLDHNIFLKQVVQYILNRNPQHRPSIQNILDKLDAVFKIFSWNVDMGNRRNSSLQQFIQDKDKFNTNLEDFVPENKYAFIEEEANEHGFWIEDYIGIYWNLQSFEDKKIKNQITIQIKKEDDIYKELLKFLHDTFDDSQFLVFFNMIEKEFFRFLKQIKLATKNNDRIILFSETRIIGIFFGLFLKVIKQKQIELEDLIFIRHQSINAFKIFPELFEVVYRSTDKMYAFFLKLEQFQLLQCNCNKIVFLIQKSSQYEKRYCECNKENNQKKGWNCEFGFCQEYRSYLLERFNIKIEQITWVKIPFANILGLGNSYTNKFSIEVKYMIDIWNEGEIQKDDQQNRNLICCENCNFILMMENNQKNYALCLDGLIQNFQKENFFNFAKQLSHFIIKIFCFFSTFFSTFSLSIVHSLIFIPFHFQQFLFFQQFFSFDLKKQIKNYLQLLIVLLFCFLSFFVFFIFFISFVSIFLFYVLFSWVFNKYEVHEKIYIIFSLFFYFQNQLIINFFRLYAYDFSTSFCIIIEPPQHTIIHFIFYYFCFQNVFFEFTIYALHHLLAHSIYFIQILFIYQ